MNLENRLYVAKNGSLRMVRSSPKNNIVKAMDITNMTIDGLCVCDDNDGYFTGHNVVFGFINKVVFQDE